MGRAGCEVDLLRCHLERECGAVSKVCVGAQDSADDLAKGTQVAVSVQGWGSGSVPQPGLLRFRHGVVALLIVETVVRVEADLEELDQVLGDGRVCEQGVRHEGRGVAQAQLESGSGSGHGTDVLPARSGPQPGSGGPGYRTRAHRAGRRSGHPRTGSHSVCVHALGEFNPKS